MLISQLKSALISIWLLVGFGGGFWGFLFVRRKKRKLFSSTSINKIEIIPMQGKREGKREKPVLSASSFHAFHFLCHSSICHFIYPKDETISCWNLGFSKSAHNRHKNFKSRFWAPNPKPQILQKISQPHAQFMGGHILIPVTYFCFKTILSR